MKHHAVSIAVKSVLDTVQTVAGGPEADNTRLLDTTRASDSVGEVSDGPSSGAGGMADLFTEHDAMLAEHLAGDGAELGDEELQQVQEWVLRRPQVCCAAATAFGCMHALLDACACLRPMCRAHAQPSCTAPPRLQVDFVDALQHFSSMPQDTLEAAFAELQRSECPARCLLSSALTDLAASDTAPCLPPSPHCMQPESWWSARATRTRCPATCPCRRWVMWTAPLPSCRSLPWLQMLRVCLLLQHLLGASAGRRPASTFTFARITAS